jgi:hypothetical protein
MYYVSGAKVDANPMYKISAIVTNTGMGGGGLAILLLRVCVIIVKEGLQMSSQQLELRSAQPLNGVELESFERRALK